MQRQLLPWTAFSDLRELDLLLMAASVVRDNPYNNNRLAGRVVLARFRAVFGLI